MTTERMTRFDAEKLIDEARVILGGLGIEVAHEPRQPEAVATLLKRALPGLRTLARAWNSSDPDSALDWTWVHVCGPSPITGEPGGTTVPVEIRPERLDGGIPREGEAWNGNPAVIVTGVTRDFAKGVGRVVTQRVAEKVEKPAEKPDRLGGVTIPTSDPESDVSCLPRERPTPPTSAPPGELRSKSARADLADRIPPGFGRGGRP